MLNNVGELTNWSVALMSRSICERDSKYTFAEKYTANCFYRNNATDTQAGITPDTYYIRKNHIVGDRTDEFLDLTQGLLEKALEKTKERKKESKKTWKENYPSPDIVREEFRPKEQPLLMIYPLNPRGADPSLPDNGEPFVGLVIAFPNTTRTDIAYDYVQNPVGDYLEEEELFDETNDNTYDNE